MRRYGFLLKPTWVVLTALVATAVVGMVLAGFWQLRRLDERKALNARVAERAAAPVAPIEAWLGRDEPLDDARRNAEWRRVQATGTYDVAGQVLVRNRSFAGAPGYHVVTPLRLGDGTGVLVNRGWIPIGTTPGQPPEAPLPPSGGVTVEGRVRGTQQRTALGSQDPATGVLTEMSRVDIARVQSQVPYPLLPAYLELDAQRPPPSEPLPRLVPPPEEGEGPHLAYAVQWAIFAILAVVGWVLVVRRQVVQDAKRRQGSSPPADDRRVLT